MDADIEKLKQNILEHASGTVQVDVDIPLEGAEFAILEELESNGMRTSIIHAVKRYDEDVLSFSIYLPLKEATEGIEPSMWAMLKTIER